MNFKKTNHTMRRNKSFGELILDVWAAIMRVVMTQYCVKSLTLKSRKHAENFLPGEEKEMKIIAQKEYDEQFLKARRWSAATRVKLLSLEVRALAGDAVTEEELQAAYGTGDVSLLIAVMRVYTPNRKNMLRFLSEKDSTVVDGEYFMVHVARQVPTAFASLKAWEILGCEEEQAPELGIRWDIAKVLAGVCPSWAPLFMRELLKVPGVTEGEGKKLFRFFFSIAIKGNQDISDLVSDIRRFFPELCAELRFSSNAEYKYLGKCFCVLFPELRKSMVRQEELSLWDIPKNKVSSVLGEAYAWLYCGVNRLLGNRDVSACLLREMRALSAVLTDQEFEYLINRLAYSVCYAGSLSRLYSLTHNVENKGVIEAQLAKNGEVGGFFPFKGWQKEETILLALNAMAARQTLPVDRLGELTPEQQKYALAAMEAYSQIAAMKRGRAGELVLLKSLQLTAEFFLVDSTDWKSKTLYNERFKMAPATFRRLVASSYHEKTEALICAYAQKWGLTQEQYRALLQSSYKGVAPFLQSRVVNQ